MFFRKSTPSRIVTVGGGTGTFTLLTGLKRLQGIDISAIVTVTDSGGSTGRLRDEFGYLPVGDFRQALVALAESDNGINLLRELFMYRFSKGEGLQGHSLGNLFLVAMTDVLGSEEKAIEYASKVLRVKGKVIPVSIDHSSLIATYDDGTVAVGEHAIDEPPENHNIASRITELRLDPPARITYEAREAIAMADAVVFGPGDLYTSTLPNVLVEGFSDALAATSAHVVFVINLMTKRGLTLGMNAREHIEEFIRYTKRVPDSVLLNVGSFPEGVLTAYQKEGEYPVLDDLSDGAPYRIIRGDFVAKEPVTKKAGDVLRRSLIRHNSEAVATAIAGLLKS